MDREDAKRRRIFWRHVDQEKREPDENCNNYTQHPSFEIERLPTRSGVVVQGERERGGRG